MPTKHRVTFELQPDWIDYNGHLRDAYYGLLFSYAVDDFMIQIGMDENWRDQTSGTLYVVEDHRTYLDEVTESGEVLVIGRVLDMDHKRIHLLQSLYSEGKDKPASECESLQLHVVQRPKPHAAEIPVDIRNRILEFQDQSVEPMSRAIGIRRKPL